MRDVLCDITAVVLHNFCNEWEDINQKEEQSVFCQEAPMYCNLNIHDMGDCAEISNYKNYDFY